MIVAADTTRLDGVRVIGVDEHRWSHTRRHRRVRHGHHRPDPGAGGHRPGPAARHGPRTLRRSAEVAGWPTSHRSSATRSRSWPWTGSAATRPPRPRSLPEATAVMDPFHVVALAGAKLDLMPPTRPAADLRSPRPHRRSALPGAARPCAPGYPLLSSRQQARLTAVFADDNHLAVVRDLERLPAHHRRLQPARPPPRQDHDDQRSSTPYDAAYPPDWRNWPNSAAPCTGAATMCWPTSTTTPPTDPPKPSTAAWKPYAATPSDSATSPTTDCAHCCTAATSPNRSMHSEFRKRSVGPWRVRSRGMRIGVRTSPSDAGLAWSVRPSKRLALEPSPVRVFPVAPTSASTSLHVHIEGSGDGVRPQDGTPGRNATPC